MPRKNLKKPASPKNIKKTKKQKKKSELKKRVRRVIRKKYSDDSDILYQSTREIEESSDSSLSYKSSSSSNESSDSKRYEDSSDDRRKEFYEEDSSEIRKDRKKKYKSSARRQDKKKYEAEEESVDDRRRDKKKYEVDEESVDDRLKDKKKYEAEEESVDDRRRDKKKYEAEEELADDRLKDRRKYQEEESADNRRKEKKKYQEGSIEHSRKKYEEEESVDDRLKDRRKYKEEESVEHSRKKYQEEESVEHSRKKYHEEEESADDRIKDRKKQDEESVEESRKDRSQKLFYHRESSLDKKVSSKSETSQNKYPIESNDSLDTTDQKKEEDSSQIKPLDSNLEREQEEIDFSDPIKTAELFSKRYSGSLESVEAPVLSPPIPPPHTPSIKVPEESSAPQAVPIAPAQCDTKEFDEKLLQSKFQYNYDQEDEEQPEECYSSKKIEEFILSKGFMILEYFIVNGMCSFILIQLPNICETMMVYVNRKKFPIQVTDSSYQKTVLEKLKIEKCEDDTHDYENMTLTGFDLPHTLDTIKETNKQQKSLAYYIYRQISRMMYITKNIEIKPCILLNGIFGFYEIYHMPDRKKNKEFYPVISLESLFSKTFLLEQNIPMFYNRFYSITTRSNRNKMEYLENSLRSILKKIDTLRTEQKELPTKDIDKNRVKSLVERLDQRVIQIENEKKTALESTVDRVTQSYQIKRLDEQRRQVETKKTECNTLYTDIKKAYDEHVFQHELMFHELYYKIGDMEELLKYLE